MEKLVLCFFLLVCCLKNASFGLQSLFWASFCGVGCLDSGEEIDFDEFFEVCIFFRFQFWFAIIGYCHTHSHQFI